MRTYPAYARTIAKHLVRGNHPVAIGVLLSSHWWYCESVAKVCIRPDEWELGRWEFGYLKNEHVVAVWGEDVEPQQFGELLIELMLAGPRLIWACGCDGAWVYNKPWPDGLLLYADTDLTKGRHHAVALHARDVYDDAQLRELGLVLRESERAAQLDRDGVPFLRQRAAAQAMVERIFSGNVDSVDERAA